MALDATPGTVVDLLVPGMSCAGCMRKIENRLGDAAGVTSARANLTAHRVRVMIDPARTDADALVASLADPATTRVPSIPRCTVRRARTRPGATCCCAWASRALP